MRFAALVTVFSFYFFLPLCEAESLSVGQFRELAPQSGIFKIHGYVARRFQCPECPADALCEPCPRNNVLVSELDERLETYPKEGKYLVVFTDAPSKLSFGKLYEMTIEVLTVKTTGFNTNDLELKSAVEQLR